MEPNTNLGGTRANETGVDLRSAVISAGAGAVAFVTSYLLTFLLWTQTNLPEPDNSSEAFVALVSDNVPSWKAAGMALYNANLVDVTYTSPAGSSSVNLIDAAGGGLITAAFFVPPAFLLLAGFASVSVGDVTTDIANAVAAGALTLVGYVLFALVGTFLFAHSETVEVLWFSGEYSLTIPLVWTVAFLGVVYPVVFGGLGGAGAYLLQD